MLDVRIPAEATSTANQHLRTRQLWGTDVYTADSDLVAVLTHTGYYRPSGVMPPNLGSGARRHSSDAAPGRWLSPRRVVTVFDRGRGDTSKKGCGFVVESARVVTSSGVEIDLTPNTTRRKVSPTFFPIEKEHVVHTRNSAANATGKKGLIREVTIQYNLCNEPWMKYSVSLVADQGFKRSQWTVRATSPGSLVRRDASQEVRIELRARKGWRRE